jgi:hypothetical protein
VTELSLFKPTRVCCVCNRECSKWAKKRPVDEPVILAISQYITRRGNGKSQLKNAPAVQICEACFVRALTGFGAIVRAVAGSDLKFWNALAGSLSSRYSSMLKEDAA